MSFVNYFLGMQSNLALYQSTKKHRSEASFCETSVRVQREESNPTNRTHGKYSFQGRHSLKFMLR